jgi:hypothetical protein
MVCRAGRPRTVVEHRSVDFAALDQAHDGIRGQMKGMQDGRTVSVPQGL